LTNIRFHRFRVDAIANVSVADVVQQTGQLSGILSGMRAVALYAAA
jgi:hypothetical protein